MDIARTAELCRAFGIDGTVSALEPITVGHINDTYGVVLQDGRKLILQRVNTYVFTKPKWIMENIALLSDYLRGKKNMLAHYYSTADGKNYMEAEDGFWRLADFVPDSTSYESFDDLNVLQAAGSAFGAFQTSLADFPAESLHETIADFHNTKKRYETLDEHVRQDPVGRVRSVRQELDFLESVREKACRLCRMTETGEIPLRVTHNDTKTNNVLFRTGTCCPTAVIDLDTVMPGLSVNDFGDAIRYAANTAAEDEKDLSRVQLDLDKYTAFARGFLSETAHTLTETELACMALGAYTMTAELVVRFLDDYIVGDRYFKTAYPEHNLVRARCQAALLRSMEEHYGEMCAITAEICRAVTGEKQ